MLLAFAHFIARICLMEIKFDSVKNQANLTKHGISMIEAQDFQWATAIYDLDRRKEYGEDRWIALGFIGDTLYVMIFTPRADDVRIISLRRANSKERSRYEEAL